VGILHDGELAVQLVDRANSLVPPNAPPGLQAWLAGRAAGAYSRVGDQTAALHALDRAEGFANRAVGDEPPWPFTHVFGDGLLDGYRGAIAARLGLPQMALPALAAALKRQNPGRIDKYRALALGDLAMSHLPEGEVEESVRLTAEAFDIGSQLGSYRVLQRVREYGPASILTGTSPPFGIWMSGWRARWMGARSLLISIQVARVRRSAVEHKRRGSGMSQTSQASAPPPLFTTVGGGDCLLRHQMNLSRIGAKGIRRRQLLCQMLTPWVLISGRT